MPDGVVAHYRAVTYFLKRRSKALRASSALRGAGGPPWGTEVDCEAAAGADVPSRATVTRGLNDVQSLLLSLLGIRIGIGFRHWKRVEGSKWEHCLQQCKAALHLGHAPVKSTSSAS